jgi:hypothetical protein
MRVIGRGHGTQTDGERSRPRASPCTGAPRACVRAALRESGGALASAGGGVQCGVSCRGQPARGSPPPPVNSLPVATEAVLMGLVASGGHLVAPLGAIFGQFGGCPSDSSQALPATRKPQ